MNTTENNKLIAEFMQLEENNSSEYLWHKIHIHNKNDLYYHSDWNWLMEVVEKIESIKDKQGCSFFVEISKEKVHIKYYYKGEEFDNIFCYYYSLRSKKETLYIACVEFIKWYNGNN